MKKEKIFKQCVQGLCLLILSAGIFLLNSPSLAVDESVIEAIQYRIRGYDYQRQGDFNKAMENYRKAVECYPFYACAHNDIGILYEQRGQVDKAEREYLKAIEIDPGYASAYTNLASLYEANGKLENACYYWGKRVQLGSPSDRWTAYAKTKYNELCSLLAEEEKLKKEESLKRQKAEEKRYEKPVVEPKPAVKEPGPVAKEPKPVVKEPKPAAKEQQRAVAKPTPVPTKPAPAPVKPKPAAPHLPKPAPGVSEEDLETAEASGLAERLASEKGLKLAEDRQRANEQLKLREKYQKHIDCAENFVKKGNYDSAIREYKKVQDIAPDYPHIADLIKNTQDAKAQEEYQRKLKVEQERRAKEDAKIKRKELLEKEKLEKEQKRRQLEIQKEQDRLKKTHQAEAKKAGTKRLEQTPAPKKAELQEPFLKEKVRQAEKEKEELGKKRLDEKINKHIEQCKKYLAEGKYNLAKEEAKKIEALDPERKIDIDKLAQEVKQAEDQKEAGRHFARGKKFYSAGKYKDAEREFQSAVDLNPNDTEAYRFLRHSQRRTQLGRYGQPKVTPQQAGPKETVRPQAVMPQPIKPQAQTQPAVVAQPGVIAPLAAPAPKAEYKAPAQLTASEIQKNITQEVEREEKASSIMAPLDIEKKYEVMGVVSYRSQINDISALNEELLKKAKLMGADEVIQVKYFQHNNFIYGYGTAVKKKK